MTIEQLVTAGTTTPACVRKMLERYKSDAKCTGNLDISYYDDVQDEKKVEGRPVKTHLKLTIVDRRIVVMGSGNMDRASWFTSQEFGVAVEDGVFAESVRGMLEP